MTEGQFQAARKLMQSANYIRGQITEGKGYVAKWGTMLEAYKKVGTEKQVNHAQAQFDKAVKTLEANRKKFADLKFPADDVANPKEKWVAALDSDSFNYKPKKIGEERFLEANAEGMSLHDTKALAQYECDALNAQ
jgi:hypothetical protein